MNLRAVLVLALSLICAPALAQVTPGTTPLSIAKGGTAASTAAAARTSLGLGTIATQNSSAVAITGGTITGMPNPGSPADVANKNYVDTSAGGQTTLAPSNFATAAILPNTPTYSNGASGVGATLTAGSNSTLTVDSSVVPLNSIVLVNNQASAFQNGIYQLTTAGSGAAAWVLTRVTYFNQSSNMLKNSTTVISGGVVNINTTWVLLANVTTVGTTAANFNQSSFSNGITQIGGVTGTVTLGPTLQIPGNVLGTVPGASVQTGSLTPAGTASTTGLMMGLGLSGCTITPAATGRVHFEIAGYMTNGAGNGFTDALRFGTGTAPSHNGAPAGTQIGAVYKGAPISTAAGVPTTMVGIATGLTLGTAVWFDADILSNSTGTSTIVAACTAYEF